MQELFPKLKKHIISTLHDLPQHLESVMPLQAKHRRVLPYGIEELSHRLTTERGLIKQAYWSAPRLTAAYLWYFLPWNILRLCRLLAHIELDPPAPRPTKIGGAPRPRIFMDMGSGPLSLPIALWLAKPQWREYELNIICLDTSIHPLQLGQKLFTSIAGENCPWRIIPLRAKLEAAHQEIHKIEGIPWLISAANVCNEMNLRQGQEDRAYNILENLSLSLKAPDASLLLVEPGTRLGGKTIVQMREAALECGLIPISPCPHLLDCPLDESRTWCHFTFDTQGSPSWLNDLSKAAKLRKTALSLSFLLLKNAENISKSKEQSTTPCGRIISAPFKVPNIHGDARYICCKDGLGLIGNATNLPSGALVEIKPSINSKVDQKSGATILEHAEKLATNPNHATVNQNDNIKKTLKAKPDTKPKSKPLREKKKVKPAKKNMKKFWEQ